MGSWQTHGPCGDWLVQRREPWGHKNTPPKAAEYLQGGWQLPGTRGGTICQTGGDQWDRARGEDSGRG